MLYILVGHQGEDACPEVSIVRVRTGWKDLLMWDEWDVLKRRDETVSQILIFLF